MYCKGNVYVWALKALLGLRFSVSKIIKIIKIIKKEKNQKSKAMALASLVSFQEQKQSQKHC